MRPASRVASDLEGQIAAVRRRIEAACRRGQRPAGSVRLMLVTKTVPPDRVRAAAALGFDLFGENRVQEAADKYAEAGLDQLEVHMIGHLQRNKVKAMLRWASCLQSVDREALVQALEQHVDPRRPLEVFIQVNTSLEASKYGVAPEALLQLAERVEQSAHLHFRGLMTIGRLGASPEEARGGFKLLRELRDGLQARGFAHATELSMGMSRDLEVAVEEGATLLRVGTAVFGTRPTTDLDYWPPAPDALPEGYGTEWDDDFAFIGGFTSGGAPFGTPWDT